MNCKPGDLAIVVRSIDGTVNLGLLLEVIGPDRLGRSGWWYARSIGGMGEVIDSFSRTRKGFCERFNIEDSRLRPIRDGEGNESWFKAAPLEYAKPKKVAA